MSDVIRGDTTYFEIPIVKTIDENGDPIDPPTAEDLKGCTVWCTVKTGADIADTEALYQHWIEVAADGTVTSSEGMTVKDSDPLLGIVVQKLTPVESAEFAPAEYTYDVQVMLPNGDIKTVLRGSAETILPDWTRAIIKPSEEV